MKKLLSIILALALVLGLSTAAFASDPTAPVESPDATDPNAPTDPEEPEDPYKGLLGKNPSITKNYTAKHGKAPEAAFTYTFSRVKYIDEAGVTYKFSNTILPGAGELFASDMPEIEDVKISFDAVEASVDEETGTTTAVTVEKSAEIPINLDAYKNMGTYVYKITEKDDNLAGVTYSTTPLYLVVTILKDGDGVKNFVAVIHEGTESGEKTSVLYNTYDSGTLTVKKTVAGNMASTTKKFKFTIVFSRPGNEAFENHMQSNSSSGEWRRTGNNYSSQYEISLADGESVTISNIPAGLTYTVKEDSEHYKSEITSGKASDSIAGGDEKSVTFKNTLDRDLDVGINLDSLPYILLIAVVCVGLVGFLSKKRMMHR